MGKVAPIDVDSETVHPMLRGFAGQVKKSLLDLAQHLLNLSPLDNFAGQLYEGTIGATTEVKITNRLKSVPRGKIVIFNQGGQVEDGSTPNTKDFLYLENTGASPRDCQGFLLFIAINAAYWYRFYYGQGQSEV